MADIISTSILDAIDVGSSSEEDDSRCYPTPRQNVLRSSQGEDKFDPSEAFPTWSSIGKRIDSLKEYKTKFMKEHGHEPAPGHVKHLLQSFATPEEITDLKTMSKKSAYSLFDKYFPKGTSSYMVCNHAL